jgi:hypothetical protein
MRVVSGGLGVITTGGIKLESSLISRPAGVNHVVSSHVRETGARILNSKDYQGTTNIPRVGTNRFSSPAKHTNSGLAVSRLINNRQFSPVPPHMDGSPRKSDAKTYNQSEGLMIEVGGQKMPVTGTPGKSPKSPSFRNVKGEYIVEQSERIKSPGKVMPARGTNLTTQGVRTISGGLDAIRQAGGIRGGLGINEARVTRLETSVNLDSSVQHVSKFESPSRIQKSAEKFKSPVKKGSPTGRVTGVYKGGGIITKKISGTRGLNYL